MYYIAQVKFTEQIDTKNGTKEKKFKWLHERPPTI